MITRRQMLALGFTEKQIRTRIARGSLHPQWPGVYAVGRPGLSREGRWLAAVLACGRGAVLSHGSAAALWEIGELERGQIEVSVPSTATRRLPGIRVHRRTHLSGGAVTTHRGIAVTDPVRTLMDLATRPRRRDLGRALNEAAIRDLVDLEHLDGELDDRRGQRGVPGLRAALRRHTLCLTRSELERRFIPLGRAVGLWPLETGVRLNGFEVDFFHRGLGLVIETDGLRYHRTPAQQARDRLRDNAHAAAGLTSLRFTHAQVRHEPRYVKDTLRTTAARLRREARRPHQGHEAT